MTQFNLSRILFSIVAIAFIVVRIFFTIRFREAEELSQKDNKKNARERKFNFLIRRFVILPLIICTIWIYYILNPSWMQIFIFILSETILWIVTVIGFIGITFLIWVHISLGKEWYANLKLRNDHLLIKSGPYSKIRHPMYTALFIIYLSLAFISTNILLIILIIFAIISIIIRLPKEEEMLILEFGDEYKHYMKNTGRFFPKFHRRIISDTAEFNN
jgi:protein-S-isoprenylcysteine O-methyltransferase Ste14